MNQLQIVMESASDEANIFGVQIEQPLSINVGKSLYHKPYGMVIDAAKQDARVLEG